MRWLMFVLQLLAIEAFELGDDIFRGNLHPPNAHEAVRHAQHLAHFEQAHGLFIEPAVQLWARHLHALFGLLAYATIVRATDVIYAAGQTIVPVLLAIWIVRSHRSHWLLVRNIALLTTLFSVIGYELYPVAPPRLTTGLLYEGHVFHFQNTTQQVIGGVKLNGVPLGYNAYSAMPSVHIAMALLVVGCLLLLTRNLPVRLLAALYPFLMLFTVLVSANHYLLDALGGALVVVLATVIVLALEPGHPHLVRVRVALNEAVPDAAVILRAALQPTRTTMVAGPRKGIMRRGAIGRDDGGSARPRQATH